jgi:hypothetical protein
MLATFAASKNHNFKHLGSIGNSLSNTCNKWRSWKLCKELWNSPPQQHLQQVKKELETLPRNSGIHPATTATSGFVNSLCQKTLGIYPTTATSGFGSKPHSATNSAT